MKLNCVDSFLLLEQSLSVSSSSGQPDRVLITCSRSFISPAVFMTPEARALCVSARLCVLTVVSAPLEGYIKNTEKLNYGKEHQYKLMVTAYDCGKRRAAEDVLVKVSIKPTCTPGWQGELRSPFCSRTRS